MGLTSTFAFRNARSKGEGQLPIEDRRPDDARVRSLPDSAVDRAEIESRSLAGHASHSYSPAPTKRPDQSPTKTVEELWGRRLAEG